MLDVTTIIAAKNADAFIQTAIRSALAQEQCSEVIVVDDGSTDATAECAERADDRTGRLRVIRLKQNVGPSAARNMAIEACRGTHIAILDADDFFLPGRFGQMAAFADWDLIADDIAFTLGVVPSVPEKTPLIRRDVDLITFIQGNLPSRFVRGELGFLKPVIRLDFLRKNNLSYDPRLRLGEDFALYTQALLAGARFSVISNVGYAALIRDNSLSSLHKTDDLKRLRDFDRSLLQQTPMNDAQRRVLTQHARLMDSKFHHRLMLDLKRERGFAAAVSTFAVSPAGLFQALYGIAKDKIRHTIGENWQGNRTSETLLERWFAEART